MMTTTEIKKECLRKHLDLIWSERERWADTKNLVRMMEYQHKVQKRKECS